MREVAHPVNGKNNSKVGRSEQRIPRNREEATGNWNKETGLRY